MTDNPQSATRSSPEKASMTDPLRACVEALGVLEQTLLEVEHAYRDGPDWYTRGESGLRQQVRLWLNKGHVAVREANDALTLARSVPVSGRDEILEEAARIVDKYAGDAGPHIAAEIRALKHQGTKG